LCAAILFFLALPAFAEPDTSIYESIQAFKLFKEKFNKTYANSAEEEHRFQNFLNTMKLAEEMNLKSNTKAFGVNGPFADMTKEEFAEKYLLKPELSVAYRLQRVKDRQNPQHWYVPNPTLEAPTLGGPEVGTFDWRSQNPASVTPVKDQGNCGSCWAFAGTAALENAYVVGGSDQKILAPQQLVDCTYNYNGCDGGWYTDAWSYLKQAGGQALESSYPYTAGYNGCQFSAGMAAVDVASWTNIAGEADLFNYVTTVNTPAVAVDAQYWYMYNGGGAIYPPSQCSNNGYIDHAVVVTGYTNIGGTDVWTIRNSWGTGWGNQGYIYIPMNVNACSIGDYPAGVNAVAGPPGPPPPPPSASSTMTPMPPASASSTMTPMPPSASSTMTPMASASSTMTPMMSMSATPSASFNPCKAHPAAEAHKNAEGLQGWTLFGIVVGGLASVAIIAFISFLAGRRTNSL